MMKSDDHFNVNHLEASTILERLVGRFSTHF